MLADTQSLSQDSATDVDTNLTVFTKRFADSDKSVFSVAGLTLPNENKLTVSHETTKAGNQRHLIRTDLTVVDAFGVPATAGVYLVIDRPSNTAVTDTILKQMVNRLVDFLVEGGANANVTAVLNNEV
jgi:hypothetical protein